MAIQFKGKPASALWKGLGAAAVCVCAVMLSQAPAQAFNRGVGSTDVRVMNINTNQSDPSVLVTAEYYSPSGVLDDTASVSLPSLGNQDFLVGSTSLPDGWSGTMTVSASKQTAALGTTTYTGGDAAASVGTYRGFSGGATTIYFPNLRQRPAQYSVLSIQNVDSTSASVSLYYYDRLGNGYAGNPVTDTIPVGGSASYDLSQKGVGKVPDLGVTVTTPDGWVGALRVVCTNGKAISGVSSNFNKDYSTCAPAALEGKNTLYFPAVTRRMTGSTWLVFSGTVVQNLSASLAASLNVTITDRLGNSVFTFSDTLPPLSAHGYNTRFPADMPPSDFPAFQAALGTSFNGAMIIDSDQPIVGLTDQQSLVPGAEGQYTYLGEESGSTNAFAPKVFRMTCTGFKCQSSSGVIAYNPDGSTQANVQVSWIDNDGTILYQYSDSIPALSSHGYNSRVPADTPPPDFDPLVAALGNSFDGAVWISSDLPIIAVVQHFVPSEGDAYNAIGG